jgi:aldehyde dehydrogenase (NAD+)
MVSVNSVIGFAGVATLPFGGIKESGYGRIHGREGLLEYTYPRSVVAPRFNLPMKVTSFTRSEKTDRFISLASRIFTR